MSLIDTSKIIGARVDGEWLPVNRGTFDVESYVWVESYQNPPGTVKVTQVFDNSQARWAGVSTYGYRFCSGNYTYAGPLSAIAAVRWLEED